MVKRLSIAVFCGLFLMTAGFTHRAEAQGNPTNDILQLVNQVRAEYGLPAVVNVPQATQRIADGQIIQVDGTRGQVRLQPVA